MIEGRLALHSFLCGARGTLRRGAHSFGDWSLLRGSHQPRIWVSRAVLRHGAGAGASRARPPSRAGSSVNVLYKGQELGSQRLDLIVDEKLVVETKATSDLHKSATRQLYNYLKATNLELGLVLHFGPEAKFYRVICRNRRKNP